MFQRVDSFGELEDHELLFIAGVSGSRRNDIFKDYAIFGTTSRQQGYSDVLRRRNKHIVNAIDTIPLSEEITEQHFEMFVRSFSKVYSRASITTASRLLALKRPDVFYCYTSDNRDRFAEMFDIAPTTVNLDNYWERVVQKIQKCNWYTFLPGNPTSKEEMIIKGRAALLDAKFY